MFRRPGQFVALQVNISLNDVGFPAANLPHQSQFLLVNGNVSVGPLFLVDFLDVVGHVALPVVGVVAGGAVIWLGNRYPPVGALAYRRGKARASDLPPQLQCNYQLN